MKLRIKYFEGAVRIHKIMKGNWIDVYANEDVFIPYMGYSLIPLGFALELPKGWEGYLLPRSSTFKTWGIIQTNGQGIIDDTFIGNDDQWCFPAQCTMAKVTEKVEVNGHDTLLMGTWIRKGDKIGQMRIEQSMPKLQLEEVEVLDNADRGGFGTTGIK